MSVLPIRRSTAASEIAEALRDRLLSGFYMPGTALGDLLEEPSAPLPIVRQALGELERDGLVVHSLHRGIEVKRITPDDVRDLYGVRRVFEGAGLAAMMRRRPVDVSWLAAAAERMGEAAVAGDGRAVVEADMAFHLALVAAAGSQRLTRAAQAAMMELRLVLAVADRASEDLPALVADHQYLVDVVRGGNLRKAQAALADHLTRGELLAGAAASDPDL
jgi:DNA-binding GntR family transcriptional regulator